jgi:hypothetical protein
VGSHSSCIRIVFDRSFDDRSARNVDGDETPGFVGIDASLQAARPIAIVASTTPGNDTRMEPSLIESFGARCGTHQAGWGIREWARKVPAAEFPSSRLLSFRDSPHTTRDKRGYAVIGDGKKRCIRARRECFGCLRERLQTLLNSMRANRAEPFHAFGD